MPAKNAKLNENKRIVMSRLIEMEHEFRELRSIENFSKVISSLRNYWMTYVFSTLDLKSPLQFRGEQAENLRDVYNTVRDPLKSGRLSSYPDTTLTMQIPQDAAERLLSIFTDIFKNCDDFNLTASSPSI